MFLLLVLFILVKSYTPLTSFVRLIPKVLLFEPLVICMCCDLCVYIPVRETQKQNSHEPLITPYNTYGQSCPKELTF